MSGLEPAPARLWTAALAAASDRHTMDTLGVPSPILMERAALCVSHEVAAIARARGLAVGVLVGPGNNGGDGLAVARQLHGWGLSVAAWRVTERHNDAVAQQLALARAYGVPTAEGLPPDDGPPRLWVDGMLGTGTKGAPRGGVAEAVRWLAARGQACVAIDVPTGVDPDTGTVADPAVRAELTVTFARSKPGLHGTPGRAYAGRVVVADIGLVAPPTESEEETTWLLDPAAVQAHLRSLPAGAHKGQRGHLGIVGGSEGTAGAALLAGVAALRAGAGLVTIASPTPAIASVLLAARPELMTAPWTSDPAALLPRASGLVVGPGLTDPQAQAALPGLYRDDPRPALWDASALDHVPLPVMSSPAGARVITPHPGEAARMLARIEPEANWSSARVQADRLAVARALAVHAAAVVVLKGEASVVATPDGQAFLAVAGGPALATAGSGDVLAGLGGALLVRGLSAEAAARVAVHVHGVAGERLGEPPGPVALDVAEAVAGAMQQIADAATHPRWPQWRRG